MLLSCGPLGYARCHACLLFSLRPRLGYARCHACVLEKKLCGPLLYARCHACVLLSLRPIGLCTLSRLCVVELAAHWATLRCHACDVVELCGLRTLSRCVCC